MHRLQAYCALQCGVGTFVLFCVVYLNLVIKFFFFSTLNDTCNCLCLDFGPRSIVSCLIVFIFCLTTRRISPFIMIDCFGWRNLGCILWLKCSVVVCNTCCWLNAVGLDRSNLSTCQTGLLCHRLWICMSYQIFWNISTCLVRTSDVHSALSGAISIVDWTVAINEFGNGYMNDILWIWFSSLVCFLCFLSALWLFVGWCWPVYIETSPFFEGDVILY